MLLLQKQGFRVVAKDQTPEIRTSGKGNQYQRINVVPYTTNGDKEATMWIDLLLFGEDCLPDVSHNDYLLVEGKLEMSYYIPKSVEEVLSSLEKTEGFDRINYQGRTSFSVLASSVEVSSKDEIREVMGFNKENTKPAADLENLGDDEEIPF